MLILDASTLILMAKAQLLEPFLTSTKLLVASRRKWQGNVAERGRPWSTCSPCGIPALQEFQYRGCQAEIGGALMTKTMSIRMDRDNYEFLASPGCRDAGQQVDIAAGAPQNASHFNLRAQRATISIPRKRKVAHG